MRRDTPGRWRGIAVQQPPPACDDPLGMLCTTAGVRRVAMTDQESVTDSGLDVVRMLDQFEDVASFLDSLVRWAVEQTPGAEACGLTVEQAGRGRTVTYSGEL